MEIFKLIETAVQKLKEAQYSPERISTYQNLWRKGIVPFMQVRGVDDYDKSVGMEFIRTCHDDGSHHYRELAKSVDVLTNVLLSGKIGRMGYKATHPLDGEIGAIAKAFIKFQDNGMLKESTLKIRRRELSRFVEYLNKNKIVKMENISENIIVDYISRAENVRSMYWVLKPFLTYIHSNGFTERDFTYTLNKLGKKFRQKRLSSFYIPDEIKILENSISRASSQGKRDYAILMLCSRLGLRISDVANLEFSNIDWESNTINIIQYKTGNPLSLPLLPEVGNAIIDYLMYGRKESNCPKVFIGFRPPYTGMTADGIHSVIGNIFRKSGIQYNGRHHGAHSLRFSLAQRMLDRSISIPVIKNTLGHSEFDTTMTYLRIDLNHMKQCVLDVPEIPDNFYMQQGGWFYE